MTEPTPALQRAAIRTPGPFPVIAGSLGLFLAVTALLAFQMRAGADPALGEPQAVAAASPAPRKVLIRRVIITRVVEHRRRRDGGSSAPVQAAPRTITAAPAPAAAAPAPAAPAAPAPAPLTTRSS
jgi:pyruvate dehydrogenase E2 component (dihydrolipoamide acetyltransferase)